MADEDDKREGPQESGGDENVTDADNGLGDEAGKTAAEGVTEAPKRIRSVNPEHLGNFRWIEGLTGQALATILRGQPVGEDRMDVGPAGKFLTIVDHLTRLLAARFAGEEPKATGTIAKPDGVGRLQFAAAEGNASITLYFAVDQPTQLTIEGGSSLYESPMGRAVLELVNLVEMSDDDTGLIARSLELGDRISDRYGELLDFLVKEQVEVQWTPYERDATVLSAQGAAEVKAVLDQEVAEQVETKSLPGRLYEANARTLGFELELEESGERIEGTYPDEITDFIRTAWNRDVVATIRVIHRRRARSKTPFKVEYTLTDVQTTDGN
jgi:hypothetical protein